MHESHGLVTAEPDGLPVRESSRALRSSRSKDRLFFSGLAVVFLITVFAGFARTYFLKSWFGSPVLSSLLHLHGIVFSSWILLFLTQTLLIAGKRPMVHRRLGVTGSVLAVLMVMLGTWTALVRAEVMELPPGAPSPLPFLTIPLGDMGVFATLCFAGIWYRRKLDTHKRLMTLATIAILPAAIARLPFAFILETGPIAFFGLTDLFVIACAVFDMLVLRRIHTATILGGLLVVLSQPIRLLVGGTDAWISFAGWIVSFAR